MLSRLGSAIGNLFSPLKVRAIGSSQSQSTQLSGAPKADDHSTKKHAEQGPKKENKKNEEHPGQNPEHEPALASSSNPKPVAVKSDFQIPAPDVGLVVPNAPSVSESKTASDAKVNQVAMSGVWLDLKSQLADAPTRSAGHATGAYESGLKKKRSLLKNSKGGMVDKKAA